MQGQREHEELKQRVIDSLPEGFKNHLHDNLVYYHLEIMARTGSMDVGKLLVDVLDSRKEIIDKFHKYIEIGPPPVYFVGTKEMIEKIKSEHKEK